MDSGPPIYPRSMYNMSKRLGFPPFYILPIIKVLALHDAWTYARTDGTCRPDLRREKDETGLPPGSPLPPFVLSHNQRAASWDSHTHITHTQNVNVHVPSMRTCARARPCRRLRGGGMTSKKQVTRGSLPVRGRPSPTSTIGKALVLNCRGSHPRPTIPSTNVHPERTRITPPPGG
jgi:hypothetical protein